MGSCYPSKVIEIALQEVGYTEGPNNWTKYARDLDAIKYFNSSKQNVAWCGTFNYWSILKACVPEDRSDSEKKWDALYFTYQPSSDNCACACRYGAQYFCDHGAFYSSPKVGDIAFYGKRGSETHQGIVYQVLGNGKFKAIEGNHNNEVAIVTRSVSECSGFGRPRYDDEPSPSPEPTPTPPEPTPTPPEPSGESYPGPWPEIPSRGYFQKGDTGSEVEKLQNFLIWMDADCLSTYGADGIIGYETLTAVKLVQGMLGVKVDGFYGPKTEAAAKEYKK